MKGETAKGEEADSSRHPSPFSRALDPRPSTLVRYPLRIQITTAPHRISGAENSGGISDTPRKISTASIVSICIVPSASVAGSTAPVDVHPMAVDEPADVASRLDCRSR